MKPLKAMPVHINTLSIATVNKLRCNPDKSSEILKQYHVTSWLTYRNYYSVGWTFSCKAIFLSNLAVFSKRDREALDARTQDCLDFVNSLIFIKRFLRYVALNLKKLQLKITMRLQNLFQFFVNFFLELTFLQLFFRGKRRDGAFTSIQQETSFQYSSSTCCRPLPKH